MGFQNRKRFNSLLELLPYYPYNIAAAVCGEDNYKIWISSRICAAEEGDRALKHACPCLCPLTDYYRQQFAEHYREVVLRYYILNCIKYLKKCRSIGKSRVLWHSSWYSAVTEWNK